MLSDKSIKLFSYIVNVGYWTKLLPYTWDYENNRIVVENNLVQRRIWTISSIIFRLVLFSTMCVPLVTKAKGLSVVDYLYATFVGASTLFAFVIEMYPLVYTYEYAEFISSNIKLARRLAKYHKLSTKDSDGADTLISLLCCGFAIIIPCIWIMYTLQVQLQFPLFSLVSSKSSIIWNVLIGTAWGYKSFAIIFIIAFHVVVCLNYGNSMTKFLKICRYDSKSSRKQNKRMLMFYRCHQILHISAEFFSNTSNTAAILFSIVFQTTVMYIIIKGGQMEVRATLGALLVITMAGTEILINIAADYTDASLHYPMSLLTLIYKPLSSAMHERKKIRLWKYLGRIRQTCHPFKFTVLKLFFATRTTFLTITFGIVIQYLVLILTEYK